MVTRRLVQLADDTWGWSEIDKIGLKRVATDFKTWLMGIEPCNDPLGFLKQDLPLVDAALTEELPLPYKGWEPHMRELGEGLLPIEYTRVAAPFYNTIRGAHLTPPQIVVKGGKRYAWAEFEEPVDVRDTTLTGPSQE
ncbi:hypothetical protein BH09PSE5_BH09PSE5_45590 [soil metagenome]